MKPVVNNDTSGTFNSRSRKEFLEDLPHKVRNTVRGVDLALINEAVTAIVDGHATINGKTPGNRAERYIVIATYFKTARTQSNMFFDGALNVQQNYTVTFKYKDQPYCIKFPENHIEN
ncbi:MAG: hypothetical protein ACLQQ4_02310 [Bacteroidia bacterium]|jgi:hypothetical protein